MNWESQLSLGLESMTETRGSFRCRCLIQAFENHLCSGIVSKTMLLQLLTGLSLFAVTTMAAINIVTTNSTPHHLLKLDVKFDQAE